MVGGSVRFSDLFPDGAGGAEAGLSGGFTGLHALELDGDVAIVACVLYVA